MDYAIGRRNIKTRHDQWRIQVDCATPLLWSDREFLGNFCTVFVSFVSPLNRKIRVPRLLPVKTALKYTQLSFWGKMIFFLGSGRPSPLHHSLSPRRLVTEILNTPLLAKNNI